MTETALIAADRLLGQGLDALEACADSGGDTELLGVLTRRESAVRRLDRVTVSAVACLERRGAFAERGYRSSASALSDLLGWEGVTSPAALRMLCCDAAVVPVVLDGKGRPLDVGRATRTVPDGLRRQIHVTEWIIRIRDGLPEFVPPAFIDPLRTPRRKALPQLVGIAEAP